MTFWVDLHLLYVKLFWIVSHFPPCRSFFYPLLILSPSNSCITHTLSTSHQRHLSWVFLRRCGSRYLSYISPCFSPIQAHSQWSALSYLLSPISLSTVLSSTSTILWLESILLLSNSSTGIADSRRDQVLQTRV